MVRACAIKVPHVARFLTIVALCALVDCVQGDTQARRTQDVPQCVADAMAPARQAVSVVTKASRFGDRSMREVESLFGNGERQFFTDAAVSHADDHGGTDAGLRPDFVYGIFERNLSHANSTDPLDKSVFIAWRGSQVDSIDALYRDMSTNVDVMASSFLGGVHRGYFNRASKVPLAYAQEKLMQGYTVVLTGHSLGGATASVFALMLHEWAAVNLMQNEENRILCITFGTPLFADTDLSGVDPEVENHFHHFVHKDDPVPKLLTALPRVLEYIDQQIADEVLRAVADFAIQALSPSSALAKQGLEYLAGTIKGHFLRLDNFAVAKAVGRLLFPTFAPFGCFYAFDRNSFQRLNDADAKELLQLPTDKNAAVAFWEAAAHMRTHTFDGHYQTLLDIVGGSLPLSSPEPMRLMDMIPEVRSVSIQRRTSDEVSVDVEGHNLAFVRRLRVDGLPVDFEPEARWMVNHRDGRADQLHGIVNSSRAHYLPSGPHTVRCTSDFAVETSSSVNVETPVAALHPHQATIARFAPSKLMKHQLTQLLLFGGGTTWTRTGQGPLGPLLHILHQMPLDRVWELVATFASQLRSECQQAQCMTGVWVDCERARGPMLQAVNTLLAMVKRGSSACPVPSPAGRLRCESRSMLASFRQLAEVSLGDGGGGVALLNQLGNPVVGGGVEMQAARFAAHAGENLGQAQRQFQRAQRALGRSKGFWHLFNRGAARAARKALHQQQHVLAQAMRTAEWARYTTVLSHVAPVLQAAGIIYQAHRIWDMNDFADKLDTNELTTLIQMCSESDVHEGLTHIRTLAHEMQERQDGANYPKSSAVVLGAGAPETDVSGLRETVMRNRKTLADLEDRLRKPNLSSTRAIKLRRLLSLELDGMMDAYRSFVDNTLEHALFSPESVAFERALKWKLLYGAGHWTSEVLALPTHATQALLAGAIGGKKQLANQWESLKSSADQLDTDVTLFSGEDKLAMWAQGLRGVSETTSSSSYYFLQTRAIADCMKPLGLECRNAEVADIVSRWHELFSSDNTDVVHPDSSLAHLHESSRPRAAHWLVTALCVSELYGSAMNMSLSAGVFGAANAGKSTVVREMLKMHSRSDLPRVGESPMDRTVTPYAYHMSPNLTLLDVPGFLPESEVMRDQDDTAEVHWVRKSADFVYAAVLVWRISEVRHKDAMTAVLDILCDSINGRPVLVLLNFANEMVVNVMEEEGIDPDEDTPDKEVIVRAAARVREKVQSTMLGVKTITSGDPKFRNVQCQVACALPKRLARADPFGIREHLVGTESEIWTPAMVEEWLLRQNHL